MPLCVLSLKSSLYPSMDFISTKFLKKLYFPAQVSTKKYAVRKIFLPHQKQPSIFTVH